ncbi:MAG: glycosyltransferase [Bdellovibrionales bacterium]|nr:glycosyltransferase [Bdellovibrionales bacterium]
MSKSITFFFPHNPYPARSGGHQRCLEMLSAFRDLGCSVSLLSSTLWTDQAWSDEAIRALEARYVRSVRIWKPTATDLELRALDKERRPNPPLADKVWAPPALVEWVAKEIAALCPDALVMSYPFWDVLYSKEARADRRTIIDIHEIASMQVPLEALLWEQIGSLPLSLTSMQPSLIDELQFAAQPLTVDGEEMSLYNQYDCTIAISLREREVISAHCPDTTGLYIPATYTPAERPLSCSGRPLFPVGPNPLNLQAYAFFVVKVLPHILGVDDRFELCVSGHWSKTHLFDASGITLLGFVPDLDTLYENTSYLVTPVLGGTGQQVKIVEAMARGLPVVAWHSVQGNSPIVHGENGLIAHSPEEFAEHIVRLETDPAFRRRLGHTAWETVKDSFSRRHFLEELQKAL